MKKILIFALAYQPFVGGAEIAMKEITDRIDPDEYAFDMITLRFDCTLPKVERVGNVTVHRIGFTARGVKVSDRKLPFRLKLAKIFFPLTSFWKALSLDRKNNYDLVWALMANQAAFGALLFKSTHPRIPYLLELQDGNSLEQVKTRQPIMRLAWPLYRRVYREADMIKAISRFIEKLAREIGYAGPVAVIPNAVDTEKFSAPVSDAKQNELNVRFGKKPGDIFLFTASRLVLSRGVEDVIRALPFLPPRVKLLIAGDGDDRGKLEGIAREAGAKERVIFAGQVDHAELPAYFAISDIFVRPSIIEGFGSAFVEAFAAGIPVVATPVGGIPDFLTDGVTGIFCEVRNPESVARAVKKYLDDPALAARIVGNAKKLAAEKYDWNTIAQAMREEIFESLASRKS
jgi:glycosyltransferase involved in cell wall biosynthesis